MGRGKIKIKRIDNIANRQVTFSKRKNGILKKAKEITTLCDCQLSLIIFSSSNKLISWCSETTSLENILEQYHDKKGSNERLWDAKHQDLSNQIERIKKENDSIQIQLRQLKGEELHSLEKEQLGLLEKTISHGLDKVRRQKEECYNKRKMYNKLLEMENESLLNTVQQMEYSN